MSTALKNDDLVRLSKLYEAEFNKPDLHDRVLIFDVVASPTFADASAKEKTSDGNEETANQASEESNDQATPTDETGMNASGEPKNPDCEIATNKQIVL